MLEVLCVDVEEIYMCGYVEDCEENEVQIFCYGVVIVDVDGVLVVCVSVSILFYCCLFDVQQVYVILLL